MSEAQETIDELSTLKHRADMLGIQYHPSIGVEKLREKVAAAIAETKAEAPVAVVKESEEAARTRMINEANKLVRVRITCMNPFKKDIEGEIITVSNDLVGTQRKYVPFNADNGWHIPQMMLNALQERMCQVFYNERAKNGVQVRRGKMIKEFAIEILPPLTQEELKDLAQQQAMANRIG